MSRAGYAPNGSGSRTSTVPSARASTTTRGGRSATSRTPGSVASATVKGVFVGSGVFVGALVGCGGGVVARVVRTAPGGNRTTGVATGLTLRSPRAHTFGQSGNRPSQTVRHCSHVHDFAPATMGALQPLQISEPNS